MLSPLDEINKFVKYWWFRYLMITEMYMVEKWEVVTIHAIIVLIFLICWYINYSVVLGLVSTVVDKPSVVRDFIHSTPVIHHGSTT
ncbi:hypothetical protein Bhyg_06993 [Pseudolycoriella hygida]|uniref:Serine palmitoyltransferase small subunit A n=1 Tax=Pseudolycoriella hygida TaxID=35572 RepID=A0A9Q0N2W6_9DIPT|nr:hypothetical protein Bhyg_06993 [Pseudolycoriella hygida]